MRRCLSGGSCGRQCGLAIPSWKTGDEDINMEADCSFRKDLGPSRWRTRIILCGKLNDRQGSSVGNGFAIDYRYYLIPFS